MNEKIAREVQEARRAAEAEMGFTVYRKDEEYLRIASELYL